jgi:hypothetical protein
VEGPPVQRCEFLKTIFGVAVDGIAFRDVPEIYDIHGRTLP